MWNNTNSVVNLSILNKTDFETLDALYGNGKARRQGRSDGGISVYILPKSVAENYFVH